MMRQPGLPSLSIALGISLVLAVGCSGSDGADGSRGPEGKQGPEGTEGPAGQEATASPSINAVIPNTAFLDRKKTITISGFGTTWTSDATVSFGDKITVDQVDVASPTALIAHISVDPDAKLGARDVVVTEGTDVLTYTAAFVVESPLNFIVKGSSEQGSMMMATAVNRDFDTPFDASYTGDGLFTPIEFTNIQVSALTGVEASTGNVAPYALDMLLFVDVDAPVGDKDIDILSGPAGDQVHFPTPAAFNVGVRTATAITAATTAGSVTKAYSSQLFSISGATTGAQFITINAKSTDNTAQPAFAVLPSSGHFADMIEYANATRLVVVPSETYYLVYWDQSGAAAYDFQFSTSASNITVGADTEPNDTTANAVTATTMPFALKNANISSLTDQDWIKYEATANDVGKAFRIVTLAGSPSTDTVVAAYGSDGTTLLGTVSANNSYHEDHLSAKIPAAGTYYIRISADQTGFYLPKFTAYNAAISLE